MLADQNLKPIKNLSTGLVALFGAHAVILFLQVILSLAEMYSPQKLTGPAGEQVSVWFALVGFTMLFQLPLYIATAICFLIFIYRAYKNLPLLGAQNLLMSPKWAVIHWFIPLINLFVPFFIIREIWIKSADENSDLNLLGTPLVIVGWWIFWLGSGIAMQISQTHLTSPTPDFAAFASPFGVGSLFAMLSAVFAASIVNSIARRQTATQASLHNSID